MNSCSSSPLTEDMTDESSLDKDSNEGLDDDE